MTEDPNVHIIQAHGLALDEQWHTLSYNDGAPVRLRPGCVIIMAMLMRRYGDVVPRSDIVAALGCANRPIRGGSLPAYIHFLRGALRDLRAPHAIESVNSAGCGLVRIPLNATRSVEDAAPTAAVLDDLMARTG